MLKRILLLLGETPASVCARQYAFSLAKRTDAELLGLGGIDLPYIESPMPGTIGAVSYRLMLQKELSAKLASAQQRVQEVFERECRDYKVPFHLLSFEGDPTEAVQTAMEARDLVITGHDTAFRGNEREALTETLAKLLAMCARPVIVCPDEFAVTDEVMVAYDGSIPSQRALQLYALLKMRTDTRVQVLSVDPKQEVATRRVNSAADFLRAHGYEIETIPITTGVEATEVIRIEVSHRKIGTLVLGAYGHGGLRDLLFGSTTTALSENPPCPLFLYH